MPRRILITSILLLLVGNCWASIILDSTGSARSLGMGGKSIVDAKTATEWPANPATLAAISNSQIGSSYVNLFFEEIGFTFLGGIVPLKKNLSFGAAYRQIKTDVDYDLTYLEAATTFAVGYQLTNGAIGVALNTVKIESEFWGNGYSLDLGAVKKLKRVQFGFSIKNAISQFNYTTDSNHKLDPLYNLGIAYYPQNGASINLEIDDFKYLSVGLETELTESMALRLGINDRGFAGGVGLTMGHWVLDYALFDNGMGLEHRVTTSFQL